MLPPVLHWVILIPLLAACWLAWSGHGQPYFIGAGLVGIVLTAAVIRFLRLDDPESNATQLGPRFWRYQLWLLREILRSGLRVAGRVTAAEPNVTPGFRTIQAPYPDAFRTTVFACSITLTPGTVAVRVDDAADEILVHALEEQSLDDLESGRMSGTIAHYLKGMKP